MNDLISRQAAIKAVHDEFDECLVWDESGECTANEVEKVLIDLPSAEKHGKWIPVDSFSAYGGDEITWMAHGNPVAFYYCSECKEHAYVDENGENILSRFCPNCGAWMESE